MLWSDLFKYNMDTFNQIISNIFSKLQVRILQSTLTMNRILNTNLRSIFSFHISHFRKVSLELYIWVWWSTKLLQLHTSSLKYKDLAMQRLPLYPSRKQDTRNQTHIQTATLEQNLLPGDRQLVFQDTGNRRSLIHEVTMSQHRSQFNSKKE